MDAKLKSILQKEKLEHLLPIFTDQGVTDSILGDLSADDLRDLGIEKLGERKRLLSAFAEEIAPVATDKLERDEPPATRQEDFTYEAANGEITITGFRGKGHVVIPNKFDDLPLPVRAIGREAFKDNSMLVSIIIPEGVTSIGESAFHGCNSLLSVKIPDSVTSIGNFSFSGCANLINITIPDGVTNIDTNMFGGCKSLMHIEVRASHSLYTSTGGALYDKSGNKIIIVPSGVTKLKLKKGVSIIGYGAFTCCSNLTSVIIPDSVTSIERAAFFGCSNLTSIAIPGSVTSIVGAAFGGCANLSNFRIPDSVTSIASDAFRECPAGQMALEEWQKRKNNPSLTKWLFG